MHYKFNIKRGKAWLEKENFFFLSSHDKFSFFFSHPLPQHTHTLTHTNRFQQEIEKFSLTEIYTKVCIKIEKARREEKEKEKITVKIFPFKDQKSTSPHAPSTTVSLSFVSFMVIYDPWWRETETEYRWR